MPNDSPSDHRPITEARLLAMVNASGDSFWEMDVVRRFVCAQLGVAFYRETGAKGEAARCARCGEPFASRMHIDDLKQVERELEIRYEAVRVKGSALGDTAAHYQDICPACRRKNLALTQDALWRRGA